MATQIKATKHSRNTRHFSTSFPSHIARAMARPNQGDQALHAPHVSRLRIIQWLNFTLAYFIHSTC